ncbi:Phosphatidylinositol N-acetylglucosaminyltransferase-domain containing protein [Rhodotorula toruloides]|uniref:Phosphatidylinositol N-acetylglucosaminyltransferase-domain containing protein n=1 Tax=Rhodotorula toruloides TaxID=5286 RepID=A0A2T0ACE0_RHOTO|nr:Phosphatidylinositol N-acetylglucosaminyltransferase-domain containing protein [Rhodotorula toruloides]PRQ75682.1 Phosphatidylinositol N-acetylglucosaminyltransferase-domain containing protein [Rhodotorula toruloides]
MRDGKLMDGWTQDAVKVYERANGAQTCVSSSSSSLDFANSHRSAEDDPPTPPLPPYRKVLYLKQPYPDNYVDATFLADLKRNVNVHPASLPALLRQTLPITQHLACTFLFVAVFVRLSRGTLSSSTLLSTCAGLSVVLRVWSWLIGESSTLLGGAAGRGGTAVAPIIPLVALYLLSPALKTLTRATTSDSIWALSGTLFAVNLLLGDYRAIPTTSSLRFDSFRALFSRSALSPPAPHAHLARRAPLPSTLSLTAALSGSTVLASRLSSNLQVFSLLLFSTLWFGPFPLLRSSLTLRPTLLLTWLLSTAALVALRSLGTGPTVMASLMLTGTSVVAPLVRGWLMIRYKDRLSGPWDAAVPKVGGGGHDGVAHLAHLLPGRPPS